jgi:hypothetical protein
LDRTTEADLIAVKRILKYLRGTSNYGLLYGAGNSMERQKRSAMPIMQAT